MAASKNITLAQSEDLQRAFFGYCVADRHVFDKLRSAMEVVGKFGWISPFLGKLWNALEKHNVGHGVHPTLKELENSPEVFNEEPKVKERLLKELDLAMKGRAELPLEPMLEQLITWQRAIVIEKKVTEVARFFNQNEIDKAGEAMDEAARKLNSLSVHSGFLVDSVVRIEDEMALREPASRRLKFGCSFMDESLGGIAPKDFIVFGAKTGAGKTQFTAKLTAANPGKKIALFALEAERTEIERRIKYTLARKFASAKGEDLRCVDYDSWISLQSPQLDKYDKEASAAARTVLAGLRTYYRESGEFGLKELLRLLESASKENDLLVVDHLHMVDLDSSKNANEEMGRIIHGLHDIVFTRGVPILAVSHLRKTTGGDDWKRLVPTVDDLHGSSEISKQATSVFIFGKAKIERNDTTRPKGFPTLFAIDKHRREGSRAQYAGLCFYEPTTGGYNESYALGELSRGGKEWTMVDPKDRPFWAKHATVTGIELEEK